jgi:VanZ family protein
MSTLMRRPRAWRVLLALLATLVSALALAPTPPEQVSLGWDKLNHAAAFAALAVCAVFGWRGARAMPWALLGLLVYGGAIELLQQHVPGRSASWADLLADGIGIAIGALLARWWLQREAPQSPP